MRTRTLFPGDFQAKSALRAGLGVGYLNQDSLSAAKFVAHKFATVDDKKKGWLLLSKSRGRGGLLDNVSQVFMGRLNGDLQIKSSGDKGSS